MKKYDYSNLKGDEQVTHNWAPLIFKIKDNYNYVLNNPLFKLISNILSLPIFIILYIIDKIFLGFCIINKDKVVDANVCVQPIKFVFTKSDGAYKLYKRKKRICAVVLGPLYPNMELEYKDRIKDLRDRAYESMKKEI